MAWRVRHVRISELMYMIHALLTGDDLQRLGAGSSLPQNTGEGETRCAGGTGRPRRAGQLLVRYPAVFRAPG
jgi:hypothetical protein